MNKAYKNIAYTQSAHKGTKMLTFLSVGLSIHSRIGHCNNRHFKSIFLLAVNVIESMFLHCTNRIDS